MNPYPFELLNHFTVPCTSCLLWTVTPGGGLQQDAAMSTNCAECIKTELGVNRAESLLFKTLCISPLQNRFNSSPSHYLGPITLQASDASMERVFSKGIAGTSCNGTSLLTAFSL